MSVQTPVEVEMKANLVFFFNAARDQLPLPRQFYQRVEEELRRGMAAYAEETTLLTDPEQREILREGVQVYIDDYVPDLMVAFKDSTETFLRNGYEQRAFSSERAETIVLTETRRVRAAAQLCADLIERQWQ